MVFEKYYRPGMILEGGYYCKNAFGLCVDEADLKMGKYFIQKQLPDEWDFNSKFRQKKHHSLTCCFPISFLMNLLSAKSHKGVLLLYIWPVWIHTVSLHNTFETPSVACWSL